MMLNRKILPLLSFIVVSVFSVNNAHAQYPGMAAFRAQQNQQFIQQQMSMQMQMMMNMRGGWATVQQYDFLVVMRDSSKKEITSAIYTDSATRKRFIVLIDKKFKKSDSNRYQKIYPSQTAYIAKEITPMALGGHGTPKPAAPTTFYRGVVKDSCWMFKVITGAITVYSDVCEEDGTAFNPASIVGIQLIDGPIIKYNQENLKQMVGQDINALEAIQNKNLYKAIKRYNRDKEKEAKK